MLSCIMVCVEVSLLGQSKQKEKKDINADLPNVLFLVYFHQIFSHDTKTDVSARSHPHVKTLEHTVRINKH